MRRQGEIGRYLSGSSGKRENKQNLPNSNEIELLEDSGGNVSKKWALQAIQINKKFLFVTKKSMTHELKYFPMNWSTRVTKISGPREISTTEQIYRDRDHETTLGRAVGDLNTNKESCKKTWVISMSQIRSDTFWWRKIYSKLPDQKTSHLQHREWEDGGAILQSSGQSLQSETSAARQRSFP